MTLRTYAICITLAFLGSQWCLYKTDVLLRQTIKAAQMCAEKQKDPQYELVAGVPDEPVARAP